MFSPKAKFLFVSLVLALLFALGAHAGNGPPVASQEALQNKQGMQHFKHGYYDLIPHGRKAEAQEQMAMAESAFLKAIDLDPGYVEAHRNLARLYYLQEKFDKAAYEYGEVVRLDPGDLDSYLQLALAQSETGDFDGAVRTLETAKEQTRDERILRQLNEYIEKIRQAE